MSNKKRNIKFIILQLTFFVFILNSQLYAQKAKFDSLHFYKVQNTTFEEIKKLAKEQNKIIFIDFYTVWCGPCKQMDLTTFRDPKTVKIFNENFINYKVNAESETGRPIAAQFHIDAYPTFMFISPSGLIVNRLEGVYPPKNMQEQILFAEKYRLENEK